MKWMEFIRVQTAGPLEDAITPEIIALVKNLEDSSDLQAANVYDHLYMTGYFAVSLLWNTDQPQSRGSLIGLNIIEALKKYGLVDHSVWIKRK